MPKLSRDEWIGVLEHVLIIAKHGGEKGHKASYEVLREVRLYERDNAGAIELNIGACDNGKAFDFLSEFMEWHLQRKGHSFWSGVRDCLREANQ